MKYETAKTGVIHPSTGCAVASRTASLVGQESSCLNAYSLKIYGSDNASGSATTIVGMACDSYASGYYKDLQFINCDIGFRANAGGRIHAAGSSGVCSQYGFEAVSGGLITIANSKQCGGNKSNTHVSSPGQIIAPTSVTYEGGNQTTDGNTAPTPTTSKTVTIKSNSGDTYRSSVYNNWKKIILVDKVIMAMEIVMVAGSLVVNLTNLKINLLAKLNLLLREYLVVLMRQFL